MNKRKSYNTKTKSFDLKTGTTMSELPIYTKNYYKNGLVFEKRALRLSFLLCRNILFFA
ncbi:MAG: hypothetical protein AAGU27_02655 [Dehalobacterium sp.]